MTAGADSWVSPEVWQDLYDKNLYAYCDNNAPARVDVDGNLWIAALMTKVIIPAAIGAAASGAASAFASINPVWGVIGGVISGGAVLYDAYKNNELSLGKVASSIVAFGSTAYAGSVVGYGNASRKLSTVAETFAGGVAGLGGNLVSSAVDAGISQTRPSQVSRRCIGSGMKYNGRTGQRDYFKIYQTDKGEIYEEYV